MSLLLFCLWLNNITVKHEVIIILTVYSILVVLFEFIILTESMAMWHVIAIPLVWMYINYLLVQSCLNCLKLAGHKHITTQCSLVQSAVLRSHVVRPSVTLVDCDHIGWKSRKLIPRTISPTPSLFVAKRRSTYSHGNMGKFRGN